MGEARGQIQRAFVDVGDVTLHVRAAGRGPAVLLIHQAPVSGRILESRIRRLSRDFFCLAPDLLGNGESDALTGGLVTIERMADVFLGLLDKLGIERVAAYGQHTGALCAVELALRAPDRVSAVLIGGYPIYTAEESSHRLTTYAPEFPAPTWDGGHLSWLWYRYREQFVYWPWTTKEPRVRATCAIPTPEFLHDGVAEIAARHDTYAAVYHAAFDYDAEGALARATRPMHFMLDLADSLSLKIELAAAANPNLKRWPGDAASIEATEHDIIRDAAAGAAVHSTDIIDKAASSRRRTIAWGSGAIGLTIIKGTSATPPCLIIPPFPAGTRAILAEGLGPPERTLILLDVLRLPSAEARAAWCDDFVAAISAALPDGADVIAGGSSAALAALLRARLGAKLGQVVLLDCDARPAGDEPFDASLCPAGGHLLRLWQRLRFDRLRPPSDTPRDPASVRGRHESLVHLGHLGWHAVERLKEIPAWDELVASAARQEAQLLADDNTHLVFTGIDQRGGFSSEGYRDPILIPGCADAPFREAIAVLDRRRSSSENRMERQA